ncbi:hypothetical protein Droror1_Dr00027522 [Drosera rotundifolia]
MQDTLKSPPLENQTMKTASSISVLITTFFYMCCGCFGYAAFGDDTPGNLLTRSGFYEPYWFIDFANACIILHLVGGYQVYSHAVFAFVEGQLAERFYDSRFVEQLLHHQDAVGKFYDSIGREHKSNHEIVDLRWALYHCSISESTAKLKNPQGEAD